VTIGRVFHYTPLVDDLPAAEAFFCTYFAPHCFYRGYSPHWHRQAAIYVIGEFVVEPLQPLPPGPEQHPSSWYRYMERNGPRVHNLSFYADDLPGLAKHLDDNGIRTTDGGNPTTLFMHPKDFPGMLEFFDPSITGGMPDPRRGATWSAAYWRDVLPLGLLFPSHVTVVVGDHRAAAKRYIDALGSTVLPDQPARTPRAHSTFVTVGPEAVVELAEPDDADCPLAGDLDRVGDSICGVTFRVRDLAAARAWIERNGGAVHDVGAGAFAFDRSVTFGSDYAFTDRPLDGDPRTWG
jgi:Glyoxalase/Bleomycin resistance protein/Dioxygenase superfamily